LHVEEEYVPTPPSLEIITIDIPLDYDEETLGSGSDWTSWSLEKSEYPLPHCNPADHANVIGHWSGYNLPHTTDFNPNKFNTHMQQRLGNLPFSGGYFDGTESPNVMGNYMTTHFQLPLEYNGDYHSTAPEGHILTPYLESAIYYVGTLYKSLKDYREDQCNEDGALRSNLIACYLPSIYFGRTPAYKLHVYCPKTDYWANVYSALHAVLVALTPQQAAGCLHDNMFVILLDGTTSALSYVHREEFYQQCAPTTNPLFTFKEVGFM